MLGICRSTLQKQAMCSQTTHISTIRTKRLSTQVFVTRLQCSSRWVDQKGLFTCLEANFKPVRTSFTSGLDLPSRPMFQNCGWLCYPLWTWIFDLHGALFELFRSHGLELEYKVQGSRFVKWLPLSCETGDAHTAFPSLAWSRHAAVPAKNSGYDIATGGNQE